MPKPNAFASEAKPMPPMSPCAGCGKAEATREGELFILVGEKWCCDECFKKGPGKAWPRPMIVRNVQTAPRVQDRSARLRTLRKG